MTAAPLEVAQPSDAAPEARPALRVLVIEDHRLFADLMRWTVERSGR